MINLKCESISKHYNQPLLDEISFSFRGVGVVGLIGDNGSGKSTFLKILAGVEDQHEGKFDWNVGVRVGYMPQEIVGRDRLSGGQKKIEKLAELIYGGGYDVLLLDEPDNHLDFEGKDWLIEALSHFSGLVIMISHDRDFLAKTTKYVWMIEDRKVRTFPFGYAQYEEVYENEQVSLERLYALQLAEEKRLIQLVKDFRLRLAQGKVKPSGLRAMMSRLERHRAGMIKNPAERRETITIKSRIEGKRIKGKTAVLVKDMSFSYGNDLVFKGANLHMFVGEKVLMVAPNGSGKTTLIRLLLGDMLPDEGVAKVGVGLKVGYYAQEHFEALDEQKSALQLFMDSYPMYEYEVEAVLRQFLFSKQTMKTRVGLLSGGQKARLQLALFLYRKPDLLILDEPTNHLDIKSIVALENFLKEFEGSVLLITHDRELIEAVEGRVVGITDKKIKPVWKS